MGRKREFGANWWAEKWIAVLESFAWSSRLQRGRTYLKANRVKSISVLPGRVEAKVRGSRLSPYTITINVNPLSDKEWDIVTDAMASQAVFAAKLLAGKMPETIEDAFEGVELSLFPRNSRDIETHCSCPDWANPCKHIAAVYYLLGQEFDKDPFLIFLLRGRTKDQIIDALRKKRSIRTSTQTDPTSPMPAEVSPIPDIPLEHCLDSFWKPVGSLDDFSVSIESPEVRGAVLKRLGKPYFKVDRKAIETILLEYYKTISNEAIKEAYKTK